MSRLERLHALAWSLPDVQPAPGGGPLKGAQPGEAPGAWQMCGTCDGEGYKADKWGRDVRCVDCAGAGRFRVDAFTLQRVSAVDSHAEPRGRRVTCDRCGGSGVTLGRYVGQDGTTRCRGCDGAGHVLAAFDGPAEPSVVTFDGSALARTRARGDWPELEAALTALALLDRLRHRRWVFVRVSGQSVVSPGQAADLVETDGALLRALPASLKCPADVLEAWRNRERYSDMQAAARAERLRGGRADRKRARVRELLRMGHGPVEASRMAGVSLRTAQRAASELVGAA